jgi:hypothetical protein
MKLLLVIFLTISFCGCIPKKTNPDNFDSIDYSFYVGYFASIKILSTGQVYIWKQYRSENNYYSLTLDKTSLDSISKMTKILFEDKVDSFYTPDEIDHPISFKLIIKSKKGTLSTKFYGGMERVRQSSVFNMATFLNSQCGYVRKRNDSNFVFESKAGLVLTPPPPPDSN